MSKHAGVVRLFAIAAVMTATIVVADSPSEPESALAARVAAYWQAIAARDLSTAYRIEKQAHARELDPFDYFEQQSAGIPLRAARVDNIEQDGDRATATITAASLVPLGGGVIEVPKRLESRWERLDGDWYHVESKQIRFESVPKQPVEEPRETPVDQAPPVASPTPADG